MANGRMITRMFLNIMDSVGYDRVWQRTSCWIVTQLLVMLSYVVSGSHMKMNQLINMYNFLLSSILNQIETQINVCAYVCAPFFLV